jgi:iron complex outermembrane receptor protein
VARFTFSAALFDLKQDNQYTNTSNDFVKDGEQHNLGLELGLQGRIGQNLDMTSTLALTRSRLKDIQSSEYQGHQTQNVPTVRLASYISYQVPQVEGLRLLAYNTVAVNMPKNRYSKSAKLYRI